MLAVLSIYWGVLFRVRENLRHATIAVVNFDASSPPYNNVEPVVGPFVEQVIRHELATQQYPLGYKFLPPTKFNNDPIAVRLAVHEERYWGAIIVNNNATALLRQAVENGNFSYDPFGAAQIVTNQARDIESFNQYITPVLLRLASDTSFAFGREWTSQVLKNSSLAPVFYSNAPQALSPGIGFSIFNLRPFGELHLSLLEYFNSNMTFRPSGSNSRCQYRPHLPHHHRFLLFRLLHSYTYEVRSSFHHFPTPASEIHSPHYLALPLDYDSLPFPFSQLQPRQPFIPDPVLSQTTPRTFILAKDRRRQQR